MGLELWSAGAKAVSFLPSRFGANVISGVEQLPKLGAEVVEVARVEPLLLVGWVEPGWLAPPTATPVLLIGVTAAKLVFSPKTALNAGTKFNCMKLTS
jgi:hypothetical protein